MTLGAVSAIRPKAPLFATVNITGRCNLACAYCFFWPRRELDISLDDFAFVVDTLAAEEVFFLVLSGGEPYVHPGADRLIRLAHERFEHVQVLTNGMVLSASNLRTVGDIVRDKGSFPVQVSLDSVSSELNRKTRGETAPVLHHIRALADRGANVSISIVVTRHNVDDVTRTVESLTGEVRQFHVMQFKRQPLNPNAEPLEVDRDRLNALWVELDAVRKSTGVSMRLPCFDRSDDYQAEGAPCMAGFSHVVIDPDLRVRACDSCTTHFVGDLRSEPFGRIWNSEALLALCALEEPLCAGGA